MSSYFVNVCAFDFRVCFPFLCFDYPSLYVSKSWICDSHRQHQSLFGWTPDLCQLFVSPHRCSLSFLLEATTDSQSVFVLAMCPAHQCKSAVSFILTTLHLSTSLLGLSFSSLNPVVSALVLAPHVVTCSCLGFDGCHAAALHIRLGRTASSNVSDLGF